MYHHCGTDQLVPLQSVVKSLHGTQVSGGRAISESDLQSIN